MAASSAFNLHRIPLSERLAGLAIVVGAVFSSLLCLANDSPAACLSVLLVFGMALIAVAAGRSVGGARSAIVHYRMPEAWATRDTRPVQLTRSGWGPARLSY